MSQVPNQNQNQKLQLQYDEFQQTIEQLSNKISQLQGDVDEHSIVIETLNNVPKDRKCFRMIGGALVEKTSGEVAPVLETNLKNVSTIHFFPLFFCIFLY
ncbi:hypothetical protein B5S28_g1160 [[Candida] boidinii]|nr:hypothetical protein B5S28_g1160 [[Candida] boidinii]OWB61281.1 hypothetical protein B5S29_g2170 [[Candida] boidinii]OWB74502.1 hypothetical protein B5S31_g4301 [[Candida] boidinii]OWB78140.1 hypothetical protein B5S32_g2327 [[Candida] boidinii]